MPPSSIHEPIPEFSDDERLLRSSLPSTPPPVPVPIPLPAEVEAGGDEPWPPTKSKKDKKRKKKKAIVVEDDSSTPPEVETVPEPVVELPVVELPHGRGVETVWETEEPDILLALEPAAETEAVPDIAPGYESAREEAYLFDEPAGMSASPPPKLSTFAGFEEPSTLEQPKSFGHRRDVPAVESHPAQSQLFDIDEGETFPRRTSSLVRAPASTSSRAQTSPRAAYVKPVAPSSTPPGRYSSMATGAPSIISSSAPRYNSDFATRMQRKESFGANAASARSRFLEAPPPHMPQAHFFGLPDLLDIGQKTATREGKPAGSDGYCCIFDSFADSGDSIASNKAKDALIVGSEGGVDIYRVLPSKLEVVAHLEGLHGSVIGAKILPHWSSSGEERPLIALVIHGPALTRSRESGALNGVDANGRVETAVEIFSLRTQQHVSTLYRTVSRSPGELRSPFLPDPIGQLSVEARGRYVLVASGKSGEIFVFSAATNAVHPDPQFRCIGKFWTCLQCISDGSKAPGARDGVPTGDSGITRSTMPLFSLSNRWLALVWPTTSSPSSILGAPLLSDHHLNPVGLASHVAPPPPLLTCDVAGVDEEGAIGRLTRQAAQGIMRYSQMSIEMGWQGWKELTNPTPQSAQHNRNLSADLFPPTKAPPEDPRRVPREPAVVSIVDLDALLEAEELKAKHLPLPLATFALTEGCNFLSFSHSGLRLLTATRNGEAYSVWDLSQSAHGFVPRDTGLDADIQPPQIKHIFRIPRSSHSVAVDAAWSRDDDFLALLTLHGTVHLHEIPSQRPSPKRRRRRSTFGRAPPAEKAPATVGLSSGLSPPSSNSFLGTIKSGWQQVSTGVTTIRSQNPVSTLGLPTSFAGFREVTATASQVGGRFVAKGLSQGYTAAKGGASDYWHAEENKIRQKDLSERGARGCLRWIQRNSSSSSSLAVVCGATVHLYSIVRSTRRKGEEVVSHLKHEKGAKHFALQFIRTRDDGTNPPGRTEKSDDCLSQGPHGFWTLRISTHSDSGTAIPPPPRSSSVTSALPLAMQTEPNDVETNPAYCPFHLDARVSIFALDPDSPFYLRGHGFDVEDLEAVDRRQMEADQWLFGSALPVGVKISTHDEDETGNHVESHDLVPEPSDSVHTALLLDSEDELAAQMGSVGTGEGEHQGVEFLGSSAGGTTLPVEPEPTFPSEHRVVANQWRKNRGRGGRDGGAAGDRDEVDEHEDAFGAVEDF